MVRRDTGAQGNRRLTLGRIDGSVMRTQKEETDRIVRPTGGTALDFGFQND